MEVYYLRVLRLLISNYTECWWPTTFSSMLIADHNSVKEGLKVDCIVPSKMLNTGVLIVHNIVTCL